jgi:small subunit ribosomal protein S20
MQRLRTQSKKMASALASNDVEKVKALLSPTLSMIDRSIHKGILHKGAAARRKSRLMQKVNTMLSAQLAS